MGEVWESETRSKVRFSECVHGRLSSDTCAWEWSASELLLAVSPSVLKLPTCVWARWKALDQENATVT